MPPSPGTLSMFVAQLLEQNLLLIVPPHCNRFQMVLDMMETLNTRGKRSALVRGVSGGQRTELRHCSLLISGAWAVWRAGREPQHTQNRHHQWVSCFFCFLIPQSVQFSWLRNKSGIACDNIDGRHCHQTALPNLLVTSWMRAHAVGVPQVCSRPRTPISNGARCDFIL